VEQADQKCTKDETFMQFQQVCTLSWWQSMVGFKRLDMESCFLETDEATQS
jgi:hypothetical protein